MNTLTSYRPLTPFVLLCSFLSPSFHPSLLPLHFLFGNSRNSWLLSAFLITPHLPCAQRALLFCTMTVRDKWKHKPKKESCFLCVLITRALMRVITYLMNVGGHTRRRSNIKTHLFTHTHRDTDDLAVNQRIWIGRLCVGWIKGNLRKALFNKQHFAVERHREHKQAHTVNLNITNNKKWLFSLVWVEKIEGLPLRWDN